MNEHIDTAKNYVLSQKKEFLIGLGVVLGVVILVIVAIVLVHSSAPKITQQPANACDLVTLEEAKELMGEKSLNSTTKTPVMSGDTATSNCGYTDGNPDTANLMVAAILVRSAINDKGIEQNKTEFNAGKPSKNVETIKDLGDAAYFNAQRGQLNVLDGNDWIVLSYGLGSEPQANTVEDLIRLANKAVGPETITGTF